MDRTADNINYFMHVAAKLMLRYNVIKTVLLYWTKKPMIITKKPMIITKKPMIITKKPMIITKKPTDNHSIN